MLENLTLQNQNKSQDGLTFWLFSHPRVPDLKLKKGLHLGDTSHVLLASIKADKKSRAKETSTRLQVLLKMGNSRNLKSSPPGRTFERRKNFRQNSKIRAMHRTEGNVWPNLSKLRINSWSQAKTSSVTKEKEQKDFCS